MKVSEDRFPLLLVYLEEQEQQNARARTVTRGAAAIIGRWPQYLTYASYVSAIGLLALLVCFGLSLLVLSVTAPEHNPRRFSLVKCSEDCPDRAFYLARLESFLAGPSDSFIVDVLADDVDHGAIACSVESYLLQTTLPVYHVRLVGLESAENASAFEQLAKKFGNYKTITANVDSFLRGTNFEGIRDRRLLTFVVKVLIAWNFGGVVLDSGLITLSNFHPFLDIPDRSVLVGLSEGEVVLLASRDVCHSFIFDLMKHLAENNSTSRAEMVRTVYKDFCNNGQNCTSVEIVSDPFICSKERNGCVFMNSTQNPAARSVFSTVCPLTNS